MVLSRADSIRSELSRGPLAGRQLFEKLGISQPTGSRALNAMAAELVRIGAARSIRYALRDVVRGLPDIVVYRVDPVGRLQRFGTLIAVRPDGFVMHEESGSTFHTDGLPWWLFDMRPQGYLGRAYAARHGAALGLPERLADWTDTHALRALLVHGHDLVGNLLLGDVAKAHFLAAAPPEPVSAADRGEQYRRMALEAARGDTPGSSAAGEQPKFTTFVSTATGPRHVIVKFSEVEDGPVSERWRDLLMAEHLALETLREAGLPASTTRVLDHADQRFLEVERFDRVGASGRRGLISLAALDAEFVGAGTGGWPVIARRLAASRHIRTDAAETAELLWAFGTLIGNSDMHAGNLSFVSEEGRPYGIAPAYDMTPMCFAPRSGGGLPDHIPPANLRVDISHEAWRQAEALSRDFLGRVVRAVGFSHRFSACIAALEAHMRTAAAGIERLG